MIQSLVFSALFLSSASAGYYGGGGKRPGNGGGGGNSGNRGCESGWMRFNRPSGEWCVRVFGGHMDQAAAERRCRSVGATLSGVQNSQEINQITRSALRVITSQHSGSVWIGAKRTSSCNGQILTRSCTTRNSFYWTDSSTTGTAGFVWEQNQPDNAHSRSQNCAILLASSTPSVTVKEVTWRANHLDDVGCSVANMDAVTPRKILGYVCGKRSR